MNPARTPSSIAPLLREPTPGAPAELQKQLARTLRAVRTHLGMNVAFVSQFASGRRVFRAVDSASEPCPIRAGGSDPLEETYCQRVVDGRLPELIHDAALNAEALRLPVTSALPVGAHLSVPIRLSDGQLYGTFCCFSFTPDHTLNDRDLAVMYAIAELAADLIDRQREAVRWRAEAEARIVSALSERSIAIVYQPIYHVAERRIVGFESLSRFEVEPRRSPDLWFKEAGDIGLGAALELKAAELALQGIDEFPEEVYVSLNVSPGTIIEGDLLGVLDRRPLERIVLEVTEHSVTSSYADIARIIAPLRKRGMRIAVDDAGAGYASFRHILSLAPDVIKLDMSLTRNIDTDLSRRSLAKALIGFANSTGSKIVAEGVERAEELATLRELGVNKAQGWFIGKPQPLAAATSLARTGIEFADLASR